MTISSWTCYDIDGVVVAYGALYKGVIMRR